MTGQIRWTIVREQGGRTVSHYLATSPYYHMTLKIWPTGGFITVRRFLLEIYFRQTNLLTLTFYKKRDAETWANALFSESGAIIRAVQLIPAYT